MIPWRTPRSGVERSKHHETKEIQVKLMIVGSKASCFFFRPYWRGSAGKARRRSAFDPPLSLDGYLVSGWALCTLESSPNRSGIFTKLHWCSIIYKVQGTREMVWENIFFKFYQIITTLIKINLVFDIWGTFVLVHSCHIIKRLLTVIK